jgi:hypothetical protein
MSTKNKPMRWHVTDGRDRVGNVILQKEEFVAFDLKDQVVGKFATLHEAMNSITSKKEK